MDESSEKSGEGGLHCNPADGRPDAAETGSIDQIRDIIFGSQMKAYERRFQRLEERSQQRFDELHAEVGRGWRRSRPSSARKSTARANS